MDFFTHATLHAAPIAGLALLFAFGEAKRASSSGLRLCGAAAAGASGRQLLLAAAALCALLGGGWRVRDLVRRGSPGSPQLPVAPVVYVPTYMPPITAPYALNLSCAQADGSRGTCSPNFCAASTEANTLPACTGGAAALTTAVDPATYLATVRMATCTASTDARCTAAALAAQFSGMSSVYAAFCNAGYLVLVTSTYQGYAENLDQVVSPPKGTLSNGTACRTRSATIGATGMQTKRVTLTPTLLSTASLTNNINWFTSAYPATTEINTGAVFPLPNNGPVGFTITGQDIYPCVQCVAFAAAQLFPRTRSLAALIPSLPFPPPSLLQPLQRQWLDHARAVRGGRLQHARGAGRRGAAPARRPLWQLVPVRPPELLRPHCAPAAYWLRPGRLRHLRPPPVRRRRGVQHLPGHLRWAHARRLRLPLPHADHHWHHHCQGR